MVDSYHAFYEIEMLYNILSTIGEEGASLTMVAISIVGGNNYTQKRIKKRLEKYCEAGLLQRGVPRYRAKEWYVRSQVGKEVRDSAGEIIYMKSSEEREEQIRHFVGSYPLIFS